MPYRTPPGGVYDSGDHPALLDALLRDGGHAEMLAERDRLRATGRLAGVGMAMIVDPSGTNLGYIDLARTPEERGRGLGKSGCTESATLSMNPMGGVRLRIATAPEGQGHETVAAQIVADELGVAREMILRGRRMLAEEALHCGLVCEVTAPEDLRAAALRIAGELAAGAGDAEVDAQPWHGHQPARRHGDRAQGLRDAAQHPRLPRGGHVLLRAARARVRGTLS
jgi:hypothetical protein